MLECCKCSCDPNCFESTLYLPDELFCDGTSDKEPDCPDASDEDFKTCCDGDYDAVYT